MRTGVTLADVTRAADQLLAAGERPTVDGVRKVLGTGSPATVNNHLKDYYQALPMRLNMPASITTAAAELYRVIRETAQGEAQDEQTAQLQELERERSQLATDRRGFETERVALQQQVSVLQSDKSALLEQRSQLNAKLALLERQVAELGERAAAGESKATAAVEERERAGQRQIQELQRLREQAEGNERHLLGRIEDLQQQLKRLNAEREKEGAAAQQRNAGLETAVSEANKALAGLRTELAGAQREAAQERSARQERDRLHDLELDRLAKENQAVVAERDQLRAGVTQGEAALKRLAQERDDALREAARQEGKLQGHQARIEELRQELTQLRQPPRVKGKTDEVAGKQAE